MGYSRWYHSKWATFWFRPKEYKDNRDKKMQIFHIQAYIKKDDKWPIELDLTYHDFYRFYDISIKKIIDTFKPSDKELIELERYIKEFMQDMNERFVSKHNKK